MSWDDQIQRRRTRTIRPFLFAFLAFAATVPARANTYLFSFTTTDLKAALLAADGLANYNKRAYFGVFVQPSSYDVSNHSTTFLTDGYTYGTVNTPNGGSAYPWSADKITDPSNPDLGYGADDCTANRTWAGFYKGANASNVAVVSGATVTWLGASWFSANPSPTGWGFHPAVIQELMSNSAVFSFPLNTTSTLAGSYFFRGFASKLESSNPLDPSSSKKEEVIGFTLDLTGTSIPSAPEPATFAITGASFALLAISRRKLARKRVN